MIKSLLEGKKVRDVILEEMESITNNLKNSIIVNKDNGTILVQKKEGAVNYIEIIPIGDKFEVNIVSGTIENPSKASNGKWYQLYDKQLTSDEILGVFERYGIN